MIRWSPPLFLSANFTVSLLASLRVSLRASRRLLSSDINRAAGLLIWVGFSAGVGCVLPPQQINPSVIPREELAIISSAKRGKDYANNGRFDLAEQQFRKAIKLSPGVATLYNDLGFVLSAQDRYPEALTNFVQSLRLTPFDYSIRDNVARTLYLSGDLEGAQKFYERNLVDYFDGKLTFSEDVDQRDMSATQLAELYRNIAVVAFALGDIEEAFCYSQLATKTAGTEVQASLHARLLLSVERAQDAITSLDLYLKAKASSVSGRVFVDYGLALYSLGRKSLARDAFARVLSSPDEVDTTDRSLARLLSIALLDQETEPLTESQQEERDVLVEQLFEQQENLCDEDEPRKPSDYWPMKVITDVTELSKKLCNES